VQSATSSLRHLRPVQSEPHPVLLGLTHLRFEAQEEPIVVLGVRPVDGLFIDDENVGKATQLEQPMPIRRRTSEARYLQRENRAHAPVRNVLGELLEAAAPISRLSALSEVLIDDLYPFGGPTEVEGSLFQSVLARRRFRVRDELRHRGLAEIHAGAP